uniref:Transcription initiation factor IIA subunit 2 n=5 Tax=Theria TaxID=32525 RepID=A0A7N4NP95_SARHA
MAYQLYRNTTLGNSLQESLDELIQSQQITPQLALQVLLQFDKAINSALAQRVRNRVNFRGSLNTYRFCDNVWTFVLNDVEFREVTELIKVDKVKIVACDGKSATMLLSLLLLFSHNPVLASATLILKCLVSCLGYSKSLINTC